MNTVTVVNIKCGGCEKKIRSSLSKAGLAHITINIPEQKVTFEGDVAVARKVLARLGYPQAGSPEAQSIIKKGHSYLSCAIGRLS